MRRRSKTARLFVVFVLVLAGGAVAVGVWSALPAETAPDLARHAVASVEAGPDEPPVPFLTDDSVVGLPDEAAAAFAPEDGELVRGGRREVGLRVEAAGGLMGWTSPVGVVSPDGRSLAYNAWTELVEIDPEPSFSEQGIENGQPLARPSLRLLDLASGTDSLLEDGAYSLAWRADGALAYFKGRQADYRANERYVGAIMVRSSPTARPVAWTSAADARYIVVA